MIVLVDAGNSRIKLGWLDAASGRREPAATAFEHGQLDAIDDWLDALPGKPRGALGVNVAGPRIAAELDQKLARRGCPLQWMRPQAQALGLVNGYGAPHTLGADRWAALLGTRERLAAPRPPFVLATFGTATTVDTVGPDEVFAGGLILPGPALMRASLANGTSDLPLAPAEDAAVDFPTDTRQAIASGVAAAQAGAVVRQWLAGLHRYRQPPRLYASGGGWSEIAGETRRLLDEACAGRGILPPAAEYVHNPVLDGLARLARDLG